MTHWVRESASSIKVSALLNDFREVVGTFYRQLSNVNIGSSSTSLRGLWSPEYNLVSELGDSRSVDPQTPAETSLREQDVCRYRAERWSHFFHPLRGPERPSRKACGEAYRQRACFLYAVFTCGMCGGRTREEKREQMWIQSSLKAEREKLRCQGC